MHIFSLVLGVLCILGMTLGFIPCFGWFNWINIPFAIISLIICVICYQKYLPSKEKQWCKYGIIMSFAAITIGLLRLIIGGGFI